MKKIFIFQPIVLLILLMITGVALAQPDEQVFKASGTPENPKVDVSWNRYYTYEGIEEIAKKLQSAYPGLVKVSSIGKSYEGRDIWALTITNFDKGKENEKPGFYIDGNIHSNEIQGSEVALYTAWYLVESFEENEFIRELLNEKVFYIVPTINPDARENFMESANTAHSPRSGMIPVDDDRDGLKDEDGFDDLNGDGHITFMRRKNPNGRYKEDPDDPRRLIRVKPDEAGNFEMLGYEGYDNDGDSQVNEDAVGGYYDPNRDWGWNWQPDYIQRGAFKYPFSVPENRAVADFVLARPNIAGAQSYHNTGGMILRGPGSEMDQGTYTQQDQHVYDAIGKKGEKLLPGYKYMVLYKDLYTTFGGEVEWFHAGRGIFSFTNELFTSYMLFHDESKGFFGSAESQYQFDKYLLFEDAFVEWQEYDHPQYGKIEIGGLKKNYTRANPGFLLESDAHRNMAFTLYHAYQTPKLVVEKVDEKELGGGVKQVTVTIANKRLIPTHSTQDLKYKIERPDYISIDGPEVLTGMQVINEDMNITREQTYTPERIEVENIPGMGTVKVRWIINGNRKYNIKVDSAKGGVVEWNEDD